MAKSIPIGACVLCLIALMGAGVVSARTGNTVAVLASPPISVMTNAVDSSLTAPAALLATTWSRAIKVGDDDDEAEDKDADESPAPVPEPSTLLSFGVAAIIGGGVFFLGRLRKERK
jgi:hypothetical protein